LHRKPLTPRCRKSTTAPLHARDAHSRSVTIPLMSKTFLVKMCLVVCLVVGTTISAAPQLAVTAARPSAAPASQGIFLVFPFENDGASPRLDWLCEGLEELTIQRLSAAGQQVFTHSGRTSELDRYGLPSSARFSHATMLRIGADLDADFVVFGKFNSDGKSLTMEVRFLRVSPTAMSAPIRESGKLESLMDLHTLLVWKLLAANDKTFPLNVSEFSKLQRALRLDAFEHYIRGLLANEDEPRIRELREAVRLEPDWPEPAFALGQAYFSRRDCDSALPWLMRVPAGNPRATEATFTIGVCRLLLNQPDKAEQVFLGLQDSLKKHLVAGAELPEILNDLALAQARGGNTTASASSLLRAIDLDPDEDDYPFNLGLLYLRGNDATTAAKYFRLASDREPDNPEDRALLIYALEKAGNRSEATEERKSANESLGANSLPAVKPENFAKMQRTSTELDTATLQLEASSRESSNGPAALATAGSPSSLVRKGRQELVAGRLDAAEAAFRAVLAVSPRDASAHRGLSEVFRRKNKRPEAILELQAALEQRDSAVDRTTLARIYLEQKKPELARAELARALKIAPNYAEARQLQEHLQNGNSQTTSP
jgi:tetratricopeptide (TPR) repeat protein/TolB-like protein